MAREATDATKLARELPKFGEILKTKHGRIKALGGNEDYVDMYWDLNQRCKKGQVFEIRVGDRRVRISKQALEHFLRAV
jgi:hypothetical protein